MFMAALFLLSALFLFGFISTAARYVDALQRVRASKSTTKKVKPVEEPSSLQAAKGQLKASVVETERRKKKDELKRVFETFDKDGDGYITREELRDAMKGAGVVMEESEIEEVVEEMDGNGDGLIDLSEFCGSFKLGIGEEEDGVLKEAFEVFDGNKDGVISVEELGMVLRSLGLKQGLKVQDCEEMIRKVDVDGDGMIDFAEFKKMMRTGSSSLFSGSSSASYSS